MTVQERKHIDKLKITFGFMLFIYLGLVAVQLYRYGMGKYDSAISNNYIEGSEDIPINTYELYPSEPTERELRIQKINDWCAAFLGLDIEPEIIP